MRIIRVTFLNGYRASKDARHGVKDWPPSPSRLFSALVSAYYNWIKTTCVDPTLYRNAIIWLAQQALPEIYCSYVPARILKEKPPGVYVPMNNQKNAWSKWPYRDKQIVYKPCVYPKHSSVYFKWDVEHEENWKLIGEILQRFHQLGRGESDATADFVDSMPINKELDHYIPSENGEHSLGVYYPGRLEESDFHYGKESHPNRRFVNYEVIRQNKAVTKSIYSNYVIFKMNGDISLNLASTALISMHLRNQLLKSCSELNIHPQAIVGHHYENGAEIAPRHSHVAISPLPFVGQHGTGAVYGVCVAVPNDINAEEQADCLKVIHNLKSFNLNDYEWKLERPDDLKTLSEDTWTKSSQWWATVTPIEGTWTPYKKKYGNNYQEVCFQKNREWLMNLMEKLGLPDLEYCEVRLHPYFDGSMRANDFNTKNKMKRNESDKYKPGYLFHARFKFVSPVSGLLVIGKGATTGIGLCKPLLREQKSLKYG